MNDNPKPDPREKLVGSILAKTVVCEEHIKGVPRFLEKSGCSPKFQEDVQAFLKPVVAILSEMEKEVIEYTRGQRISELLSADNYEGMATQLEAWSDSFTRMANSPQQMKAAKGFREFVEETVKGKDTPEKGKEPKAKDNGLER